MRATPSIEKHKNGWPHAHPLLACGGLQGNEIELLGTRWYELFGGNRLQVPRSQLDVAEYAAKYLVKDIGEADVMFSVRLGHAGLQSSMRVRQPRRSYDDT